LRLGNAWPYALVPALVFTLLETTCVYLAIRFVRPWALQLFPTDSTVWLVLGDLTSWVAVGAAAFFGWFLAMVFTPPLSAPALERIVDIVERDVRAPERAPLGIWTEFWCGLRSTLVSSAVTLPLIIALTLLELVFAPIAVVTMPLKLLLTALGVSWTLFDYPLTLRGVGARQRMQLMKRHLGLVLGFGTAFALVFWLPCCSVVMLPVGVVAATQLLWQIERALPEPTG
jgi:uncharacterized protein involved in cysteine biosynthesis